MQIYIEVVESQGFSAASGELEIILQEFEVAPLPVYISTPQEQYAPQKVKAFVDYAKPVLHKRLRSLNQVCAVR